jgi:hypothetical protein
MHSSELTMAPNHAPSCSHRRRHISPPVTIRRFGNIDPAVRAVIEDPRHEPVVDRLHGGTSRIGADHRGERYAEHEQPDAEGQRVPLPGEHRRSSTV